MLARVNIGYSALGIIKALSREDYEELRKSVWGLRLREWKEGENAPPDWYSYGEDTVLDSETDFTWLARFKIPHEIKEFKNTYKAQGTDSQGNVTNINIALPNIGLLVIDEVDWLDDACTQDLQRRLDEGWRILAVCPPNGTRRPDYILGRSKK